MTAYATEAEFESLGLPAAARTRAAEKGIDVALHLEAQSRIADSFFGARVAVPLATWDAAVTRVVCDLAAWSVLTVVGFNPEGAGDRAVLQRYEAAMEWLTALRDRSAALPPALAAVAAPVAAALSDPPRAWYPAGASRSVLT